MVTEADFYELLRYCPLDCPFLRKKKDSYIFLCLSYQSFLHVNPLGRVMRHHLCGMGSGYEGYSSFKDLLAKKAKESPLLFTREEEKLLENIFLALDTSEQMVMDTILQSDSLAETFTKKIEKIANSNSENLLNNVRSLLDEYEKNDAFDRNALEWKMDKYSTKIAKKREILSKVQANQEIGQEVQIQNQKRHKNNHKESSKSKSEMLQESIKKARATAHKLDHKPKERQNEPNINMVRLHQAEKGR